MLKKTAKDQQHSSRAAHGGVRILIIEARFYDDIADELVRGAVGEIEARGASYDRIAVPGALEIPQALAQAIAAETIPQTAGSGRYAGAVALGCVIRGETTHYEIVSNNANHWLMELAVRHSVPLGNGILTCETKEQALSRARGGRDGKGGDAARACFCRHRARPLAPRAGHVMRAPKHKKKSASGHNPRTVARMAAVQALYQMDLAGTDAAEVIDEFIEHRFAPDATGLDADDPNNLAGADTTFFAEILKGVVRRQRDIDPLVDQQLAIGWRLVRVDSILRAILRGGVFELMERSDIPARVTINEYINIAKAFFEADEPKVVNGVLDRIAHRVRADEFKTEEGS